MTDRNGTLGERTLAGVVQVVPIAVELVLVAVATPFVPVVVGSDLVGVQLAGGGVHGDALDRAAELRAADLESLNGVVFVGDYSAGTFYGPSFGARVLVYSGYLIRGERIVTEPGGDRNQLGRVGGVYAGGDAEASRFVMMSVNVSITSAEQPLS